MRQRAIFAVFFAGLLCAISSRAQMINIRQYKGKTIYCAKSGLSTIGLKNCGVQADWYTYVFIGRIMSIAPAAHGEKTLEIDPVEIFHGDPQRPLTVVTSQGDCLPLSVGDRWLFYLRKEKGKPIELAYGGDSLPVVLAKEQIKTLRLLQQIGNRGIVRGTVRRGESAEGSVMGVTTVIARGGPGDERYATSTNVFGGYEFAPLPAGKYAISVESRGGFLADSDSVKLSRGGCWDVELDPIPLGRISGYVLTSDGKPVQGVKVMLIELSDSGYITKEVDKTGLFQFVDLEMGKYVVAVRLPGRPVWKYSSNSGSPPKASLYYPGTPYRSDAEVIDLGTGERVGNIGFTIPPQ